MGLRAQRGNVRKRKSGGVWTWLGEWRDGEKHHSKTLGKVAAMTKAEAQEELAKIVQPVNEQRGAVEYTLQGFARQVVFPWYERSWKPSTAMTTEDRVDHHILKELGNQKLTALNRTVLQDFLDHKATEHRKPTKDGKKGDLLSHSTLAHLRWDLRQIFRMAVNDGILPRNPAELLHVPKGKRNERTTLTIEAVRTILAMLPLRDSLILKLASIVGMRPGEILALQWQDLTTDGLRITRGVYRGIIQTPKTHHSVRTAAISNSIREDFQAWRSIARNTKPEDWIFPNEKGNKPLAHGNYWRRYIKPTLDNLKMTGVTFQALRRTCASTLNNLGIDGKLVADQLGHTLDVSQNVYTKTGIARQQDAINTLDRTLQSTTHAT
jgi:integrase